MIPKFILPPCSELNDNFVFDKNNDDEKGDDLLSTYFSNKIIYTYSKDLKDVNFEDVCEPFESFPMVSINMRSIVNKENFSKFQAFLQNLQIKPLVIAVTETWITDLSQGPYSKIKGYHKFIHNNRHKSVG